MAEIKWTWTNWCLDQINWSPGHRTPSCDHAQIVNDYDTGMLTDQRRSTISKLYLVSLTANLTVWARISLELLFHEDKNLEPEIMLSIKVRISSNRKVKHFCFWFETNGTAVFLQRTMCLSSQWANAWLVWLVIPTHLIARAFRTWKGQSSNSNN